MPWDSYAWVWVDCYSSCWRLCHTQPQQQTSIAPSGPHRCPPQLRQFHVTCLHPSDGHLLLQLLALLLLPLLLLICGCCRCCIAEGQPETACEFVDVDGMHRPCAGGAAWLCKRGNKLDRLAPLIRSQQHPGKSEMQLVCLSFTHIC